MTYRELIELYKSGKLEDGQKDKVKNDIERHVAISEYLFDESEIPGIEDLENDNLRNKLSGNDFMDNQDEEALEFTKMIKSSIRKAFIKMGVTVGVIVLTIVMFVIFAMPKILDSIYYDPSETVGEEENLATNRISLDLAIYSELFLPGYYREAVIVDGNGCGNYDINILQGSSYNDLFTNVAGKIEKGKMTLYDANLLKRPPGNSFVPDYPELQTMYQSVGPAGSYSEAMEKLQNLDENDYYLAYVTLGEVKNYQVFVDWCKKMGIDPKWCAICLKNDNGYFLKDMSAGFLYSTSCTDLYYDKDTYPYLSIYDTLNTTREDEDWVVSEEVMTTHVVSMLEYMSKQTEFNKMIGSGFVTDSYLQMADNVASHGLNIYGFAVVAQKSTLLKISEAEDVAYIYTKPMN